MTRTTSRETSLPNLNEKQMVRLWEVAREIASTGQAPSAPSMDSDSLVYARLVMALSNHKGTIAFIRHGPTIYTKEGKATGGTLDFGDPRKDLSLCLDGIKDAFSFAKQEVVRRGFSDIMKNGYVAISPLARAKSTFNIFRQHGYVSRRTQVKTILNLNERLIGVDNGRVESEVRDNLMKNIEYTPSGGESTRVYTNRVLLSFVEQLEESNKLGRDFVYVGHSLVIQTLMSSMASLTDGMVEGALPKKIPANEPLIIKRDQDGKWRQKKVDDLAAENKASLHEPSRKQIKNNATKGPRTGGPPLLRSGHRKYNQNALKL